MSKPARRHELMSDELHQDLRLTPDEYNAVRRTIHAHSTKHAWNDTDRTTVLAALGLTHHQGDDQ